MELIKKKHLLASLLYVFFSLVAIAQVSDVPVIRLFDKDYYKYEVKQGETVFSLCRRFLVTEVELKTMNPSLSEGLKAGQTLLIPVKTSNYNQSVTNKDNRSLAQTSTRESSTAVDDESSESAESNNAIALTEGLPRITLLLPFSASESSSVNDRYVEFYEGFLLAVDSLKTLGLSFEVQALNVGYETKALRTIIESGQLSKTNYCIGGMTPEQISLLSGWASENKKKVILPFSSHIPEMNSNKYLYQPITTHERIYDRLSSYMAIRYAGSHFVLLKKTGNQTDKSLSLTTQLKDKFKKNGISYIEYIPDETLDSLVNSLSDRRENVIIPFQMSINEASRFITRLAAASARQPEKQITLIGYPDWQAMNKRSILLLHQLNTCLYSSFYADFQSQPVRDFQVNYNKTFGKSLLNTYPKYGLMGYDVASWFIPRMVAETEGVSLTKGPASLQNAYQFRPESSGSGAFNQLFYLINFTPENAIEVKQLK